MNQKKSRLRRFVSGAASIVESLLCRVAVLASALVCTFLLAMLCIVFWNIGAAASAEGLSFFMAPGVIEFDPASSALGSAYASAILVSCCIIAGTVYRYYLWANDYLPTPDMARAYATTGSAPVRR